MHLDGTLRNYVDLYPHSLPGVIDEWRVRVIDVEEKLFRRVCPTASTGWRDLFLINLLVTLTYLKISLGQRWDAGLHWPKAVRDAVTVREAQAAKRAELAARLDALRDAHLHHALRRRHLPRAHRVRVAAVRELVDAKK